MPVFYVYNSFSDQEPATRVMADEVVVSADGLSATFMNRNSEKEVETVAIAAFSPGVMIVREDSAIGK